MSRAYPDVAEKATRDIIAMVVVVVLFFSVVGVVVLFVALIVQASAYNFGCELHVVPKASVAYAGDSYYVIDRGRLFIVPRREALQSRTGGYYACIGTSKDNPAAGPRVKYFLVPQ